MGHGLSRGRVGPGHSAAQPAAGVRRRRCAAGRVALARRRPGAGARSYRRDAVLEQAPGCALRDQELCGYVLKKDSPSCGMERVKVYGNGGMAARNGRGLFAAALMAAYPESSGRRGRAADRPASARELHRAGVRLSQSARVLRRAVEGRRPGRLPYRAQASVARPQHDGLRGRSDASSPTPRAPRAPLCVSATRTNSWPRCAGPRNRRPSHQRPAAYRRLLPGRGSTPPRARNCRR